MNNPLIVHYYDINKLKQDCHINDNFIKLFNKFSPGPITFILKLKKDSKISNFVTNFLIISIKFFSIFFIIEISFLNNFNYPLPLPNEIFYLLNYEFIHKRNMLFATISS